MAAEATAQPPVPFLKLKDIAHEACDNSLSNVTSYDHTLAESWNSAIISSVLSSLLTATRPASGAQPPYKYSINSTIIQHLPSPVNQSSAAGATAASTPTPRRGMHAAAGAYWDNARDGIWSYKYEAANNKGLDVVVAVIWIWVGYDSSNNSASGGAKIEGGD